ncbi:MAG: hypothetical protein IPL65_02590 [Lewinellaceae bacterium]|nr:hypothetical protein [Lewinellaceae bacterium]
MIIRSKHIALYALLLSLLFSTLGCRQDETIFRPYSASVDELQQTLAQVPNPSTHTVFTLANQVQDTILITPGGVRVSLTDTDHLFSDESGAIVPFSTCPDIRVEVTEVFQKGDILARGLPTRTLNERPMESVAIVQVNVFCGQKSLQILDDRFLKVQVPSVELKPNLNLWLGEMSADSLAGWKESPQDASVYWAEWPAVAGTTQTGYELITKTLGWLNAAAIIQNPTTEFCVVLPPGFDNENSQVFVVLKNNRSVFVLPMGTKFGEFCLDGAPIGYTVQLVSLSKLGDKFLLGSAQTEIGSNAVVKIDPLGMSEAEIIQFIKGL